MGLYVKQLDLPTVPGHLLDRIDYSSPTFSNSPWQVSRDGKTILNSHYDRYDIPTDLKDWIHLNIIDHYLNIGISSMHGQSTNLPHTDTTRDYTMLYILRSGGKDVKTIFWQEIGHGVHRPRHTHPDYDSLRSLETVILDSHAWYMLDSSVIHSVENMAEPRISLQIGLDKEDPRARQLFHEGLSSFGMAA